MQKHKTNIDKTGSTYLIIVDNVSMTLVYFIL